MRSWAFVLGYIVIIYSSLPFVRDVAIALEQRHALGTSVTTLYVLLGLALTYHVVFDLRLSDRIAFLALAALAAATGALLLGLSVPEERVHFVEYGVLALLARRALEWHVDAPAQYAGAWALTSMAGLGDEAIQYLLPDRVFDWRDVALNCVAAFLALAGSEAIRNRLHWLPVAAGETEGPP